MEETFWLLRQQASVKQLHFVLPALQYLLDFPRKKSGPARMLILTPTRELAMQIIEQARELAKYTSLGYSLRSQAADVPRAR